MNACLLIDIRSGSHLASVMAADSGAALVGTTVGGLFDAATAALNMAGVAFGVNVAANSALEGQSGFVERYASVTAQTLAQALTIESDKLENASPLPIFRGTPASADATNGGVGVVAAMYLHPVCPVLCMVSTTVAAMSLCEPETVAKRICCEFIDKCGFQVVTHEPAGKLMRKELRALCAAEARVAVDTALGVMCDRVLMCCGGDGASRVGTVVSKEGMQIIVHSAKGFAQWLRDTRVLAPPPNDDPPAANPKGKAKPSTRSRHDVKNVVTRSRRRHLGHGGDDGGAPAAYPHGVTAIRRLSAVAGDEPTAVESVVDAVVAALMLADPPPSSDGPSGGPPTWEPPIAVDLVLPAMEGTRRAAVEVKAVGYRDVIVAVLLPTNGGVCRKPLAHSPSTAASTGGNALAVDGPPLPAAGTLFGSALWEEVQGLQDLMWAAERMKALPVLGADPSGVGTAPTAPSTAAAAVEANANRKKT